jgi:hypothetical protein
VSPLHMLEDDSVTAEYAVWLGVILDSSAFTGGSFRTAGADSGMFGGERQQRRIRAEALKLVGEGMFPHNLRDFLLNPLNVPAATVQMLVEARDSARAVYFK